MQDHQSHRLWNALSNKDSRIHSNLYLDGAGIHQQLWVSRGTYSEQHHMLVVSSCLEGVRGLFEWLSICSSNMFFNVPCLLWDQLTYGISTVEQFRMEATQNEKTSLLVVMDIISARLEKVKSLRSKWACKSDKDDTIDKVTSKLDRVRKAYSSASK
ncbi:hypothetical protein N7454_010797 [Penicillium verhagenii]|nr:hypothetical protein N7454_010797 [Penicillium verhagenii]